jgi:hypothetical protein
MMEIGTLGNPMSSTDIEPAIFQLVAYCLRQVRYSVAHDAKYFIVFHGFLLYVI